MHLKKKYLLSYAQLLQLTYICENHPYGKCLFDPHCVSHSYRLGHADIKVSGHLNYYIVILVSLGVS